ncbi:hypothetical protein L1049_020682 [Liquidambar formosana]|uniref:Leucine-rich repeat-containing N-terminal plant-type domain-containing protein n=1 Tax=Liquidambar formosana TaxID=63359 RepID=A0AAP0XA25_LIQFO
MLRFLKTNMHSNSGFIPIRHPTMLFLLLWLFGSSYLDTIKPCLCSQDLNVKCIKAERDALLTIKDGLTDPSGRLSSWVGGDCCKWRGVRCDNGTGHVFKLNLRNPFDEMGSELGGEVNSSLLRLKFLNYLDLSLNDFGGTQIPKFLGLLHNLRYLNLSSSSFSGELPPHLGNLSHLLYLDLQGEELHVENLRWLSGLPSLKHLNMGGVNLSRIGADWLHAVNMLPSLVELHLSQCELQSIPLSPPLVNFTSLLVLNMSSNSFNSSIPHWLFNLTTLTKLDLSFNSFHGVIPGEIVNLIFLQDLDLSFNINIEGPIPRFLGNLCNLEFLDLSGNNLSGMINEFLDGFSSCPNHSLVSLNLFDNQLVGNLPDSLSIFENLRYLYLESNSFWGSIPSSIGNLSSLQELWLSYNQMNGTIPQSIGQLSKLDTLYLHSNSWEGVLTEAHFLNLTRLETFWMDTTLKKSLSFNMSYGWIPPFRLKSIQLENCQVGPKFPVWIQSQTELEYTILRSAGIADIVPGDWISKLSSQVIVLDLSNNKIKGKLPDSLRFPKATFIELSSNLLEGPLPLWSSSVVELFLEKNLFSGPIPSNLGEIMPNLEVLYLSQNFLNGSIPQSTFKINSWRIFAARDNQLSGTLPDIWTTNQAMGVLDLANNSLHGAIPKSMGNLLGLAFLILSDNHLEGELPSSLQNCEGLNRLDLGGNNLSGNIPSWIGDKLSSLMILRLRSNKFSGVVPSQLCHLSLLHLLDVAQNNLTGFIPKCFGNLTSLVYGNSTNNFLYYGEEMMIVTKGTQLEYSSTLEYVYCIDLSQNHLMGDIPREIANFSALGTLNLSMNHLTGSIPQNIGNLRWLETLDLSNNSLTGPIPQSISALTSLVHFKLSHNNLVGRIPSGNQLQTLNDPSIYEGNPFLCGAPLPTECPGDDTSDGQTPTDSAGTEEDGHDKKDSEMLWFYVSIGPGFDVGFWGVCGTLLVKKTWRHAYFQFVDDIKDWIVLMIALKVVAFRRKIGLEQN